MEVKDYARAKFEIADVLRAAALAVRANDPKNIYPFEDLFARLAEDRFNLAVIGQFSRGKTSLMNAMLNTDRLPMGVVPLTSAITTVQYGTSERAVLEYAQRRLPSEISLDELPQFVTQRANPGNEKGIKFARIEMPAEILRQGFYLIDTPGIGSAIAENTRTTEDFLPEADAFIVVTSYDSPLSSDELQLLQRLHADARRIFLVINKMDLVALAERRDVEEHIDNQLCGFMDEPLSIEVFSVSAREAMVANALGDAERLSESGLPVFVERLTQFLVAEKNSEFLRRIFERADEQLAQFANCQEDRNRLAAIRESLVTAAPSLRQPLDKHRRAIPRFAYCAVCGPVERQVREFLQTFQYQIIVDRGIQSALHANGGLCPFHTWQYAAMASSHGTCVAFPGIFDKMISDVRIAQTASRDAPPEEIVAQLRTNKACALCDVRNRAEAAAVAAVAESLSCESFGARGTPDLCLPHLCVVLAGIDRAIGNCVLTAMVESWERTAEDMRRYALKRDGSRRAFTTHDELDADTRGLRALAGHSALNYVHGVAR